MAKKLTKKQREGIYVYLANRLINAVWLIDDTATGSLYRQMKRLPDDLLLHVLKTVKGK